MGTNQILESPLKTSDFRTSSHGLVGMLAQEGYPLPPALPPVTLVLHNVGCACLVSGILKFHEHYLGDNAVENSSDFQAGSSTALPTATSSALEQHIASVRESLGVESYYSRQVIQHSQSHLQIQSQGYWGFFLSFFCKDPI